MPFSTADLNYVLTQWAANKALYMSVHSAYSSTGANELSGGSPAYARQSASWGTASGGSISVTGSYSFNAPAASTAAWVGFWDALTSGNFAGMFPGGNLTGYAFTAPSSTSTLLAPGSGYTSNTAVVPLNTGGSALPTGLTLGNTYFVKSPSGDSFQVSATSGPGSAVTLSSDGSGLIQGIVVETFGSQGTYSVTGLSVSSV